MLVTTTERICGQEYEIIGEVFGLTTRSKNMFKDIGAGLKSVVGGEIKGYTD
ncbi:heavy metal-binding domain-containing protein, partial [Enterococcus faecalis]|uniref:heavy metal-binding domain-containing protein n=1 Tax=Enterococcus faecalis TaxID=1351 RepID=UPI003CC5E47A